MKSIDVKSSTYFDFEVESNDKDLKVVDSGHVRISRCKIFLQKITIQIGQ